MEANQPASFMVHFSVTQIQSQLDEISLENARTRERLVMWQWNGPDGPQRTWFLHRFPTTADQNHDQAALERELLQIVDYPGETVNASISHYKDIKQKIYLCVGGNFGYPFTYFYLPSLVL